jgi:amino acid adenylation domain-containing protein/non-ribosomal peptide synthase protein (TIGR01720 family)
MPDLSELLTDLSPKKRALLNMLLEKRGVDSSRLPIVRCHRESDSFPLSFAQVRLWFLDQLTPGSSVYNVPLAVRISGQLDRRALERTLTEIVRRHESLRTGFVEVDGAPRQVIHAPRPVHLRAEDLSGVEGAEAEAELLAAEEARRPFDLTDGAPFRVRLLRLGDTEHVVLLTMHHIVSDGWSMGVLVREVAEIYDAYGRGEESPLAELPIQYVDYAVWQRQRLTGEMLARELSYWKEQLGGTLPVMELPSDRTRRAVERQRGACATFDLSAATGRGLRELCRREGSTLFMVLLAGFKVLLHRYSSQKDILVGTPVAGRNRAETEALIGFFVNTLVLRTRVSGDAPFQELLGLVREACLGAYAHQDLPFEKIVGELQPDRNLSHAPLFQVMFILQNTPPANSEMPGLTLRPMGSKNETAKFALTLTMTEGGEGVFGSLQYDTDMFDAPTITRMAGHLKNLFEAVAADAGQAVAELPLLSEAERRQLLVEWNDTGRVYPPADCIHRLFERQVERTPDATALVFDDERLSYRTLNDRANRLAHYLINLGVGAESPVGVFVDRSVEMVVALLGVLKAGGAYVPLDPDYRQERVEFMLKDTGVPIVLTRERLLEWLEAHDKRTVCLDSGWDAVSLESSENPAVNVRGSNLAYVIYTSGSTGKPKGVAIEHRSAVALINWMGDVFAPEQLAGVLAATSICFDLSVFEIFGTLCHGGTVILAENALYLPALAAAEEVTLINTIPSAMAELVRAEAIPPSVTTVNLAGEPLQNALAQQTYLQGNVGQVFNLYGPSEDTTYSTFALVPRESDRQPTIGRAISNTQLYILDARLGPVPVGVPGEIYVGGAGLARGYLKRPGQTAARFVPDPFGGRGGSRLYKTGDLGRFLPDGEVEFLGRIDHQVKIRGFRIELGEVEASLGEHPNVREAVVAAREGAPGEKRLVAYVVPRNKQPPSVAELTEHLRAKLPKYMVPESFVILESLPLAPNGKVDRNSLPAPSRTQLEKAAAYVAPRNHAERVLAEIWSQVLGVESVGVQDNFFALGGDSLLTIRVISEAKKRGLRLTPRDLLENQTVAELASVEGLHPALSAEQGAVEGPVPLTPTQLLYFARSHPNPHHWAIPSLVSTGAALDPSLLKEALRHLIAHHDALRMRFEKDGGRWRSFIKGDDGEATPFTHVDLSGVPEGELHGAMEAAIAEQHATLHLTDGPVIRVVLLTPGSGRLDRVLLLTHHLVSDGISQSVLVQDFIQLYRQLSQGEPAALPAKTTSYKAWCERLCEHANSESTLGELPYWLGLPWERVAPLPRDYPEGVNTEGSLRSVDVSLSVEETRLLLQEATFHSDTRIMEFLLAALALSMAKWVGRRTLGVIVTGHGREAVFDDLDVSRTVGWFNTIYPVIVEPGDSDDPHELLATVKEHVRRIPSAGIGFNLLRFLNTDAQIRQRLALCPGPEMMFNFVSRVGGSPGAAAGRSPVRIIRRVPGRLVDPDNIRPSLLWWTGTVDQDRLHMYLAYSRNIHKHSTIKNLAREYIKTLQSLIAYTCKDTPSRERAGLGL